MHNSDNLAVRIPDALPATETAYLREVIGRVRHSFGHRLFGLYLFGSAGSGAYESGISDLDLVAVLSEGTSLHERAELADRLRHAVLPCPAKRLDFVCYLHSSINTTNRYPRFELNFNTGATITEELMLEPRAEANHWFLLDIAIGRESGYVLLGPEPADIFAPIPREWVLQAMRESLAWYQLYDNDSANNVLNACRAWRYAITGQLGSKQAGATWATSQPDCPPVVKRAEQSRRDGTLLDPAESSTLIAIADQAVRQALHEIQ